MNRSKPASAAPATGRARATPAATTMDAAVRRALSLADRPPAKAPPAAKGAKAAPSKSEVRKRVSKTVDIYAHLLGEDVVRFRPKGGGDRRIKVEYLADPQHPGSVLVRLTPSSTASLPAVPAAPDLLSTQEAADELQVSRPYLAKLVDDGKFEGVVRTASGHRRIPRPEVERVHAQMRAERRAVLDEMYRDGAEQRARELADALKFAKRRWVAKGR